MTFRRTMMGDELQPDHCPHCGTAFEIVSVKFRLTRAATLAACPNCAVAVAEDLRGAGFKTPPPIGKICQDSPGLAANEVKLDGPA
jgi:hypothetical protein